MRRIDNREGLPDAHVNGETSPHPSRKTAVMMIDAIMEELADQNIDLNSITLDDMKRLFSDACRDS